jgi:type II secretory pathway pseudopilin PulG
MIEAIMVVVVGGIILAIAGPRVAEANEKAALRASRQVLSSAFAAARAAAVQKGQVATLTLTGTSATVTVLSGLNKQPVKVLGPLMFDESLGTTVTPLGGAPTTVTYDVRGMASPRLDVITRYEISRPTYKDTVCVTETGFLLRKDCQL